MPTPTSSRGNAYYDKGALDRAIADYGKAIELEPDHAVAYYNRGLAYGRDKGDLDRAIADFDRAIEINSDYANAYHNRGKAYDLKGDYDRAIADFNKAIEIDPDYAYAYYNRGDTHDQIGDPAKALIDFKVAARLIPVSDPWNAKALSRIAEIEEKLAPPFTIASPSPPPPYPATKEPGRRVFSVGGGAVVEVTIREVDGQEFAFVSVEGNFKPGDEKSLKRALLTVDGPVAIVLNSVGGDLQAGMEIGRTIWTNEFSTVVEDGGVCASACALAWLAGRPRFASPNAKIGFHAPTLADDPARQADSVGSALVGGYLAEFGFTEAAIAYMTEAGPGEMRWLSFEEARHLGIYVEELQ